MPERVYKEAPNEAEEVDGFTTYGAYYNSNTHQEILRLAGMGLSMKEIHQLTGSSLTTIRRVVKDPQYGKKLRELQARRDASATDMRTRLDQLSQLALQRLKETLESDEVPITERNRTARDILDRAGYGAVHKVAVAKRLSSEEIALIKARAVEAAKKAGVSLAESELVEEPVETTATEVDPSGAVRTADGWIDYKPQPDKPKVDPISAIDEAIAAGVGALSDGS